MIRLKSAGFAGNCRNIKYIRRLLQCKQNLQNEWLSISLGLCFFIKEIINYKGLFVDNLLNGVFVTLFH